MKKSILKMFTSIAAVAISVCALFAVSAEAETMYVSGASAGAVYLRTAPASSNYYTTLNNGTRVNTIGWQRGWDGQGYTQVNAAGTTGWIKSCYLSYGYSSGSSYSYSNYKWARISGASSGAVYRWQSAYGTGFYGSVPCGASVYVNTANIVNGRVYGTYNGNAGWFTWAYVWPY